MFGMWIKFSQKFRSLLLNLPETQYTHVTCANFVRMSDNDKLKYLFS